MKKFIYVLAVILISSNAQAAIRSIVDWDGGANPYKPGDVSVTGENLKTKCSKMCPGFDLKTVKCPANKKLVSCHTPGCGYYNACVTLTDEEQKAITYDPLDEVDVDEVYNEIVEEQQAEKELNDTVKEIRNNM